MRKVGSLGLVAPSELNQLSEDSLQPLPAKSEESLNRLEQTL